MSRKNDADGIARSKIGKFARAWIDEIVPYRSNLLVAVGAVLAVTGAALAIGYAAPFMFSYIWADTLTWGNDAETPRGSPGRFVALAVTFFLSIGILVLPALATLAITRWLLPKLNSPVGSRGPADWPVGFTLVVLGYGFAVLGWILA